MLLLMGVLQTQYQGTTSERPQQRAEKVLASGLDTALPAIPIADWIRATVKPDDEWRWEQNACPATHEQWVEVEADRPVCVLIKVGRGGTIWDVEQARATKDALVVAVSIRLGKGNPNRGAWILEQPQVEDAFIERDGDSLTLKRLAELPRFVDVPPEPWPKSELSVSDVRCDKVHPAPRESVRCQATIYNRGPIEALVRITGSVRPAHTDVGGLGRLLPPQTIPPNSNVSVAWDWVWPQVWPYGTGWAAGFEVDLHTPHAFGGYRIPVKERNTKDNRAYVSVPTGK